MLNRENATVVSIDSARKGCLEITVQCNDLSVRAIAYPDLTGEIRVGDVVELNTTAVDKNLGTGGFHFVIANLSQRQDPADLDSPGHIMKLRYTPLQHSVLAVEEPDSPYSEDMESFISLGGMPVVIGQLHSQLPATVAGIKSRSPKAKIAFIMTDSAALPVAFSRIVHQLKSLKLLHCVITSGQAFGGDLEAINIYSALIAARQAAGADIAAVFPGPGNAGTGSRFGFSSIEQGAIVNAAASLGAQAIAVARISFADTRSRHYGISHHTLTALETAAIAQCSVVLPLIDQNRLMYIQQQIAHTSIAQKHRIKIVDSEPGIRILQELDLHVTTMGRTYEQDPEFFQSAAAAGRHCAMISDMLE